MFKFILLCLLFITFSFSYEIKNFIDESECDQVLNKKFFKVCYSYKYKGALAVYYEYTPEQSKNSLGRSNSFRVDMEVPFKHRARSNDYLKTGFHRGHIASSAMFDFNSKALRNVYLYSNIVPQLPGVNTIYWKRVEEHERRLSKKKPIQVVNLIEYTHDNGITKKLGVTSVGIPSYFTKIIMYELNGKSKCFAYRYSNSSCHHMYDIHNIDIIHYRMKCDKFIIKKEKQIVKGN